MPTVRVPRDRRSSSSETQDAVFADNLESFTNEEFLVQDDRNGRSPARRIEDRVVKLLTQDALTVSAMRNQGCDRGRPLS